MDIHGSGPAGAARIIQARTRRTSPVHRTDRRVPRGWPGGEARPPGGGMEAGGRLGLRAHAQRVDRPFQARAAGRLMGRAAGDETKVAEMTDTTRRRFLQYGMAAGAALAVPAGARLRSAAARTGGPLKKFREPLPVPGKG